MSAIHFSALTRSTKFLDKFFSCWWTIRPTRAGPSALHIYFKYTEVTSTQLTNQIKQRESSLHLIIVFAIIILQLTVAPIGGGQSALLRRIVLR